MVVILILSSILAAFLSFMLVSEATMGVWVMAGAIYIVAVARVAQASGQHKELMSLMQQPANEPIKMSDPTQSAASTVPSTD